MQTEEVLNRLVITLHGSGQELKDYIYDAFSTVNPTRAVSLTNQWYVETLRQIFDYMGADYNFGINALRAGVNFAMLEEYSTVIHYPDLVNNVNRMSLVIYNIVWQEFNELGIWKQPYANNLMLEGVRGDLLLIAIKMPRHAPFG